MHTPILDCNLKKKSVKTENGESGGWEKSVHYTHVDMTISLADRAKIKA